jgi:transitional endoplasmic reticulum ATPase
MTDHPEQLTEREAVCLAYDQDIIRAAALLDGGLSVLVHATADLVAPLTHAIAAQCASAVVVTDVAATATDLTGELGRVLADAAPDQVVIVPDLDVLAGDAPGAPAQEARRVALLLRRSSPRAVLAFLDPRLRLPDFLKAQFHASLTLDPPPPLLATAGGLLPLGRALVTRAEAAMFSDFAEARVYPHVAGLSVVQIRRLLTALTARPCSSADSSLPPPARLTLARLGQEAASLRRAVVAARADQATILEAPDLTLADVHGYADVKIEIADVLTLLERAPAPFVPQGLLVLGPAGSGKTRLARAIAGELTATIIVLSCCEVPSASEPPAQLIRHAFARARRITPSVLVLDDLDTLDDAGTLAVRSELTAATRDQAENRAPLLVIGTATQLEHVDESLTQADLLRLLRLPLPDLATRQELATYYASRYALSLVPELTDAIARATEGFTGEELRAVFWTARGRQLAGHETVIAEELGRHIGAARRAHQRRLASAQPSRTGRAGVPVTASDHGQAALPKQETVLSKQPKQEAASLPGLMKGEASAIRLYEPAAQAGDAR